MSASQGSKPTKRVRFFNVSLRNGIVVSTPCYPEKQAFCAHLISALEDSDPDFAWIQFLFVKSDYGNALVRLKNSIHRAKVSIEQPSTDLISGEARERREIHRDYYRRSEARMKQVDELVTKPTAALAIQGMWISEDGASSPRVLPFDHCQDEHDSLAVFQYRDPRMLIELVERRMVADISDYFGRFTGSRLEPPSFLVTPDQLGSYVHLPTGEVAASLRSLHKGTSGRQFAKGEVAADDAEETRPAKADTISSRLVALAKVPMNEKPLEDTSVEPLSHLAAATVRTFELVYLKGATEVLLSGESVEDMRKFAGLLGTVYGGMKFQGAGRSPAFLRELPAMVGLTRQARLNESKGPPFTHSLPLLP